VVVGGGPRVSWRTLPGCVPKWKVQDLVVSQLCPILERKVGVELS
jgi:hypothetical protein